MVENRRVPPAPAPRPSLLTTLSYVVAPVVLFAVLALVVGERRVPLGILAALLLAGTAWGYGAQSWAKLSRARTVLEADVAGQVKTSAGRAQELLGCAPGAPRPRPPLQLPPLPSTPPHGTPTPSADRSASPTARDTSTKRRSLPPSERRRRP